MAALLVRAALHRLRFSRLNELHDIADFPKRLAHASGYRRRRAQCRMNFDEIVIEGEQRDGKGAVLEFFGEAVGQSREAPIVHPMRENAAFDVGRGNMLRVRLAFDRGLDRARAFGGGCSGPWRSLDRKASHKLGVIDIGSKRALNGFEIGLAGVWA